MIDSEIRDLTIQLVRIRSINTTSGEKDIAQFIAGYFRSLPYFQAHPENLILQPIPGDDLGRYSVIAFVEGTKDENPRCVMLHGHIDTVGLEGYGPLENVACDPPALKEALRSAALLEEVRRDLESGDFMFGRGSCDMKSGDAVFMTLLKRISEHPDDLSGNVLLSLNPVEENMHTGIITSLPVLRSLQEKHHWTYVAALNNDFTAPLFPGDTTKTIYTGIGGKILPCFYVQGKETHVGQCFEGFDASAVAAELVSQIQLSMDFEDTSDGETAYPPSVLKMKDLKSWYNVQTAKEAFVYFNYFVHDAPMTIINERLMAAAQAAFHRVEENINRQKKRFCAASGETYQEVHYEIKVMTWKELLDLAEQKPHFSKDRLLSIATEQQKNGTDIREIPIDMIRYLLGVTGLTQPLVVLYYAPPYCPHSTLKADQQGIQDILRHATEEIHETTGENFRFMKFYPSLSDSSYLRIDDDEVSIHTLIDNFPAFEQLYRLPVDTIRALNIPAVNIGCFGADCHKWTERVYMPYTFGVLPELEMKMINLLLQA